MLIGNRPTTLGSLVALAIVFPVLPLTAAEVAGWRHSPDSVPAEGGKPLNERIRDLRKNQGLTE